VTEVTEHGPSMYNMKHEHCIHGCYSVIFKKRMFSVHFMIPSPHPQSLKRLVSKSFQVSMSIAAALELIGRSQFLETNGRPTWVRWNLLQGFLHVNM